MVCFSEVKFTFGNQSANLELIFKLYFLFTKGFSPNFGLHFSGKLKIETTLFATGLEAS